MGNIPFIPAPAPATAPEPTDREVEIWNAVMWAYHAGHITPAQGCAAIDIPVQHFDSSYQAWHRVMFGGGPQGPDSKAATRD